MEQEEGTPEKKDKFVPGFMEEEETVVYEMFKKRRESQVSFGIKMLDTSYVCDWTSEKICFVYACWSNGIMFLLMFFYHTII